MKKLNLLFCLLLFAGILFSASTGFAQTAAKKEGSSKRETQRKAMHSRDSLLRTLNKSDTSISSLLQRVEQYTTNFNQIKNNLAKGLDTAEISEQYPPVLRRINRIDSVANTHKSSTLRYLFVLRDNIDHMQAEMDKWQSDLTEINTKLIQNQKDLLKFAKDTALKTVPTDTLVRKTLFAQVSQIRSLWRSTDLRNRKALLGVNLLQDKISVAYTRVLDENDQIDERIKGFAVKAISGESTYLWAPDPQYNDFSSALKNTIKLNKILFNYFIKSETSMHLISILFFLLVLSWVFYNRSKIIKTNEDPESVLKEAKYLQKKPFISSLLVATSIVPFFYDHPPTIFLEIFIFVSIILSLFLISHIISKVLLQFLFVLAALYFAYSVSNLFIEISNIDRYVVFALSILSIAAAWTTYKKVKNDPDERLHYTAISLKVFIGLQIFSLLLNLTGRFSLAKIIGITAVFNLWMLVILFLVVNIIIQCLFLQFKIKRGGNSIINWIDYNLVQKKFRSTLVTGAALLWIFFLLQNLNLDDWARDYVSDTLDESRTIGGATFTFGGFVIFIFVIWISSIVSKIVSYLYDVSAQRVTDLSVARKKNRTSALIIRMGVFSIGFLLAVAASGFPLDKLTIIISAFGVGIGFGLQNIVNNLVSGLILAFEKPINIGDVIMVDGHTGTMKEIGIRSSKLATGDGSEVIIPNGDLISHQVINWTLSNTNRQLELKIITAYGVDIAKVKDLLKSLLSNREDVMATPAPSIFVNNVSEIAVEFKVFFWVDDINMMGELKSRILSDIYQAIIKEEIKLPSTQKDLFLHFPEGLPLTNEVSGAQQKDDAQKIATAVKGNLPEKDQ